jgi:hypothetical protein
MINMKVERNSGSKYGAREAYAMLGGHDEEGEQ